MIVHASVSALSVLSVVPATVSAFPVISDEKYPVKDDRFTKFVYDKIHDEFTSKWTGTIGEVLDEFDGEHQGCCAATFLGFFEKYLVTFESETLRYAALGFSGSKVLVRLRNGPK